MSQPSCRLSSRHLSMVSLDKLFSQVILAYWRHYRPDSTIHVSMVVQLSYTLHSCPLLLVVRFSQPMISLTSASMPMTTCSGAMSHGHTSGRSQSGSFQSIVHYPWDTGSFVPLIFPLENCYFLIVSPNRSLGKTKLRSVTFAS